MVNKSILFSEEMIQVDPKLLTNIFLNENIDFLKKYFDEDAWVAVTQLVKNKLNEFLCSSCDSSCTVDRMSCDKCTKNYHIACVKVTRYYVKNPTKWICPICKERV